jgi:uncharacterized membrane protein
MRLLAFSSAALALLQAPAFASALPSYACVFTEPFISIDTFPGGVRYDAMGETLNVGNLSFTIAGFISTVEGVLPDGKLFNLAISPGPAGDGMSELMRPFAGVLTGTAVGNTVNGACLQFPADSLPRLVINVAEDDVLNVRNKPNAKATLVNIVRPGGTVWALVEEMQNGWARVATPSFPKGESGDVTVVEGWVNAKFLGPAP